MKTQPSFNFVQSIFTLNMFSNFASDRKARPAQLQRDLTIILAALLNDPGVQNMIGKWEVVWGPVVGSYGIDERREAASNAMYVARNQKGDYVVAVSATNPTSLYGWLTEDLDVRTMVAWDGSIDARQTRHGFHRERRTGYPIYWLWSTAVLAKKR